jgi:hypothetical protein
VPNVFKYNSSSTEAKSLGKGNFYIGTGDVGKGPTNETGFYNGVTVGAFSYVIILHRGDNVPSFYQIQNDAELIERTNQIDTSVVRTTKEECFSYFAGQSDKMIVNKDYDAIITDGLVFHFDAGFLPSYPATSSTCYDISIGGEILSLVNGPLFDNFGYFKLDGINDRLNSSGVDLLNAITGTFSFSFGAVFMIPSFPPQRQTDTANYSSLLMKGSYNPSFGISFVYDLPSSGVHTRVRLYSGIRNLTTSGSPGYGLVTLFTTTSFSLGRWYRVDFTCSNSSTTHLLKHYVNGILDSSTTDTNALYPIAIQNSSALTVASNPLGGNGLTTNPTLNISQGSVYTKELSASEILRNYYGGNIVTSGLTFSIDAGNLVSYDRIGPTWSNLSGTLYNGTFQNSPTYSNVNNGVIDFDGTSAWVQISTYTFGNGNWTCNVLVQGDVVEYSTTGNLISNSSGGPVTNAMGIVSSKIHYRNYDGVWNSNSGNTTLSAGRWYMLTWVNYAGASANLGTMKMFVDGLPDSSVFNSYTTNGGPCNAIGRNWTTYFNGKIGVVQFYNVSLSDSEVTQNFNTYRSRFGI